MVVQDAEAASKAQWKTPEGFVYPAPRPPEELRRHPDRPSQARIDALAEVLYFLMTRLLGKFVHGISRMTSVDRQMTWCYIQNACGQSGRA
jgi:hypothetical protein